MKVAVSGARGFVGRSLLRVLSERGIEGIGLVRGPVQNAREVEIGDLALPRELSVPPVETLIHLAARVHVMKDLEPDPLEAYRRVNVQGTRSLLKAAHQAGARQFIFVSTIKVLGENTVPGRPIIAASPPAPADPYAVSKHEAEELVARYCNDNGIEWTIVRPALVYGRGVGGNFAQLISLVRRGIPLPFASIRNARSFLFVDNLSAFLADSINHPALSNRAVNLADPPALSTPQLVTGLASAMGHRAHLLPCPPDWLELVAATVGRASAARRLTQSLQVDTGELFREMRWKPPVSLEPALRETVKDV